MPSYADTDMLRSLGIHRVLEPKESFPQAAWKLDNTPVAQPSETLVDIHALHINSASFTQIASVCDRDPERMKKHILEIIAQRGKMHNPATLLTKPDGRILFFSMATSFTTAALGAEGIARQVEMQIGNSYMPDKGAVALQLLRDYPDLRAIFTRRYG